MEPGGAGSRRRRTHGPRGTGGAEVPWPRYQGVLRHPKDDCRQPEDTCIFGLPEIGNMLILGYQIEGLDVLYTILPLAFKLDKDMTISGGSTGRSVRKAFSTP